MGRQTKDPEVRKQEIINTAIQLFMDKGYEKTSMVDIAKKMGVSQGLCYRYFQSKEEIYDAALENYLSEGYEEFKKIICNPAKSIIKKIEEIPWTKHVNQSDTIIHQFYNNSQSSFLHSQILMALCVKLTPVLAGELQIAQYKGEIREGNVEAMARFCLFGQLGIWLDENIGYEEKVQETKQMAKLVLGL